MKVSVPVAIPVGDRVIKVKYVSNLVDEDGHHLYGETEVDFLLIRVSKFMCKNAQDVMDTIFHELGHVMFQMTGHAETLGEGQEEAIVRGFQYMLARLFIFSPVAGIKYRAISFPWDE
jgi:hypothetical protein